MIQNLVNLVKDWRVAAALLITIGLAAWIRPEPKGMVALAVVVFSVVFLAAALWRAAHGRAASDGAAQDHHETPHSG